MIIETPEDIKKDPSEGFSTESKVAVRSDVGQRRNSILYFVVLLVLFAVVSTLIYSIITLRNRNNGVSQTVESPHLPPLDKSPFSDIVRSTSVPTKTPSPSSPIILGSPERTVRIVNPKISPGALKSVSQKSSINQNIPGPSVVLASSVVQPLASQLTRRKILGEATTSAEVKIYRVNTFLANLEQAKEAAKKFGFSGEPERPSPYPNWLEFRWSNLEESFYVARRAFFYQAIPEVGELPSPEEAVVTASNFLRDRGLYSGDIVRAMPVKDKIDLFISDLDKAHPGYNSRSAAIVVKFLKVKDLIPIVYGSFDAEDSTDLEVAVGPNNKVIKVFDQSVGFIIASENTVSAKIKDLTESIDEFKLTGGALRSMTMKPGTSFFPGIGKYEIRDSLITKIYLAYLSSADSGGIEYAKETGVRNTGYLIPVWIFIGKGNIYGGDYHGDLVDFSSSTYAFKELTGQPSIFQLQSLSLDKEEVRPEATVSAYFNFVYGNLLGDQYQDYFPPVGLKYRLAVVYPDGRVQEVDDVIRDSTYGETAWLYTGSEEGSLSIKVMLTDFPSVVAERNVKVSSLATTAGIEILIGGVYRSSTGKPILGVKVSLRNEDDGKIFETDNDDNGEIRFENITTGRYTIKATSSDGQVLKTTEMEILNRQQNLSKFGRIENYINIGVD